MFFIVPRLYLFKGKPGCYQTARKEMMPYPWQGGLPGRFAFIKRNQFPFSSFSFLHGEGPHPYFVFGLWMLFDPH